MLPKYKSNTYKEKKKNCFLKNLLGEAFLLRKQLQLALHTHRSHSQPQVGNI